jgi:hypothetical protein
MLMTTSIRIAKVNQYTNHEMQKLVTGKHHIAWSEDIDSEIPFEGKKQKFQLLEAPYLRTFSINQLKQTADSKTIRKEYLSLGKKGCDLAQKCFPEIIDRPVDGIKLLIASTQAYDAWTNKNDSYLIEGSLATGKALLQAFNVIEPFFPVLQQYKTHKQVAGLLLKVADSVFVVKKELNDQRLIDHLVM